MALLGWRVSLYNQGLFIFEGSKDRTISPHYLIIHVDDINIIRPQEEFIDSTFAKM
jgi:hypothetical protein